MRRAWGVAAVMFAFALSLAGCDRGSTDLVDFVAVDYVPVCLEHSVVLAGDTYWVLEDADVEGWIASHQDPYGGTPQPEASMSSPDGAGNGGMLYRYDDGTALLIAANGNRLYFSEQERDLNAAC